MTLRAPQETAARVQLDIQDELAILRIDNPPVNAGSHAVRSGLVEALGQAQEAGVTGAVLIGDGRCFVAGSDLREFGKPLLTPELPDVIRCIEEAPFPVVAAMHGVALGGGLELALGCDYRIAARDTKLGLPEVSLGFLPGAGGTQRLPRLVGVVTAIDLICAAARIPAQRARDIGLVDAVADGDLCATALAFLRSAPRPKRIALGLTPPQEDSAAIEAAVAKALKRGKGRPNVAEAIRLVRASAQTEGAQALAEERAAFQELRLSDDAFALRYLFFAERRAAALQGPGKSAAKSIALVGVVGGGTMGQGIARACLAAGVAVTLVERDATALDSALGGIGANLQKQADRGRLTQGQVSARQDALSGTVHLADLAGCDLVIEAVFEDMQVKRDLLAQLEAVLAPDALLATNTSYLDIDAMADGLAHPERVLGLHFFSPADVMALLEIVRAAKTSDETLATGLKFARKLGKQPVVAQVGEGFIGNRIYAAYRRRAELLVLDGASPQEVDAAVTGFGFAMGPFAVADMSGLDIAWAMRKRQAATRDPKARYVTIPDTLCEAGRLGRKTGKGWYSYETGRPEPDPDVEAIIAAARASAGITPGAQDAAWLQRQLLAAMVNEAALLLEEGIAQHPSDVDVAISNGYGFPRWRGGPLYWAASQDRGRILADLDALERSVGHGFRRGPVARILDQIQTRDVG